MPWRTTRGDPGISISVKYCTMLGTLTQGQIEQVLQRNILGRLACSMANRLYIIPILFAYRNSELYAQSRDGLKIQMMRSNPEVCFHVDEIDNQLNWRSVICWGTYEEIVNRTEQDEALAALDERFEPLLTSESALRPLEHGNPRFVEKTQRPILFRIRITEKTGRFEKTS